LIRELGIFQKLALVLFHTRIFKKLGTCVRISLTDADHLFNYGDNGNLKMFSYESGFMVYLPAAPIRVNLFLSFRCSDDSSPSGQIEGHLPKESINGILDNPGKPGAKSVVVQVAWPEVLFYKGNAFSISACSALSHNQLMLSN
jgi:hypothetical protein